MLMKLMIVLHLSSFALFAKANTASPNISRGAIKAYADEQARVAVAETLAIHGSKETFKANFIRGLHQGYGRKWDSWLDLVLNLADPSYIGGYAEGKIQAQSKAYEVGKNAAAEDAKKQAHEEVRRRHYLAATVNKPVSLSYSLPELGHKSFRNFSLVNVSDALREKINTYQLELSDILIDRSIQLGINPFKFDEESGLSLYDCFTLDGKYHFSHSKFDPGVALQEWKSKHQNPAYDHELYEILSHTEQKQFGDHFQQSYTEQIKFEIAKKITEYDATMFDIGVNYGKKVYQYESYLRGKEQGFQDHMEEQCKKVYNTHFALVHSHEFGKQMDFFRSHPILEISATVKTNHDDMEKVTIQGQVINLGGMDAIDKQINLESSYFLMENHFIEHIPAHGAYRFSLDADLNLQTAVIAGKKYKINLEIDTTIKEMIISFSFSDLAKIWHESANYDVIAALRKSIIESIKSEWNDNCSTFQTDIYQESLEDLNKSYLGQLVKMREQESHEFSTFYSDLYNARPWMSSYLHFNKSRNYHLLLSRLR